MNMTQYRFQVHGERGWIDKVIEQDELGRELQDLGLSEDQDKAHFDLLMSGISVSIGQGNMLRVITNE